MRKRDFGIIIALLTVRQSHALNVMKCMLDRGEASVLDINSNGYTILQKVVARRKWNLAHLLISYGADINYVNQEEKCPTSPFIDAWSRRWEQRLRQSDIPANWDNLFFQDIAQFDRFGFSSLHKAYLGLSRLTFDQVLASATRSNVDESDYQGRTVLA
jgi:ankyrin repeat protein